MHLPKGWKKCLTFTPIFSIVWLYTLRGFLLGLLSITIPKASTIWLKNSPNPIGCHGRAAAYPTTPAQIPACGISAPGSSEILASLKDKTQQGLSPCKKYRASWRSSAKSG